MLARRLALLCVTGALKPFESLSTRKPWMTSSSSFAQTTATSASGLLVIHILEPLRT